MNSGSERASRKSSEHARAGASVGATPTAPAGKSTSAQVFSKLRKSWKYANGPGIVPFFLQLLIAFVVIKFILFPVLGFAFGTSLPVVAVMSGSMEHDATDGIVCGKAVPPEYSGSFEEYWATCGKWYEDRGISREQFENFPLRSGFNKGDIMVILGPSRGHVEVGDTIVYQAREAYPIIHRVVSVKQDASGAAVYATKGDYNGEQIQVYVVQDPIGRVSTCHNRGAPAPCLEGERVTVSTPGAVAILDETIIPQGTLIGKAIIRIPWLGWVKIGAAGLIEKVF